MIVNIMLTSAVRDLLVDLAVILLNFLFPGFWISLLVFCFFYYYLVTGLWTVVNLMLATRDCLTHCCRQFTRVGQPSALLQNGRGRRSPRGRGGAFRSVWRGRRLLQGLCPRGFVRRFALRQ